MDFHLINQFVIKEEDFVKEEDFGELQVGRKDLNPNYLHFQPQVVKIETLDYLLQLVGQMDFLLIDLVIIMKEGFGELQVNRKDLYQNLLDLLPQVFNQMG